MSVIDNIIMATLDQGTKVKNLKTLPIDQKIKETVFSLSSGQNVELKAVLKNGPLILIFIRGTWCPFCNIHMKRLRDWVAKLAGKKVTILVVSTETREMIKEWLNKNSFPYLFASDSTYELSDYFGVRKKGSEYAQAATFLIDTNYTIKLAYAGKRTKKNFDELDQVIEKV